MTVHVSPESCPALVLNADYRPLSYYPLSLWSWQDAIKAICLDRVQVVSSYDRIIKSPSFEIFLYWHDRYHQDPANKWMRDFVVQRLASD